MDVITQYLAMTPGGTLSKSFAFAVYSHRRKLFRFSRFLPEVLLIVRSHPVACCFVEIASRLAALLITRSKLVTESSSPLLVGFCSKCTAQLEVFSENPCVGNPEVQRNPRTMESLFFYQCVVKEL